MRQPRAIHKIHRSFYFWLRRSEIIVLPNFYYERYEMDLFCLNKKEEIVEYETKISRGDFRADFMKSYYVNEILVRKHDQIKSGKRGNKFYFVVPKDLISKEECPDYCGLIYQTDTGFHVIKRAPVLHDRRPSVDFWKSLVRSMAYREGNIRAKFYRNA